MKVSIIVCTYNRAFAISGCLDSIAEALAQAAPLDAEIVVIDNASTDNTSEIVREWAKNCVFPVRLLFEDKRGLSAARNCALRNACGDLLVWTDDDCRLDKEHINAATRHDEQDGGALILRGGRVELGDPTDLPLTIKTSPVTASWNRQLGSAKRENLGTCIFGCNMTMRRTLIERLGFFDERFGPGTNLPGGDDTDYILRAYLAGITTEYVPDMIVFHHHGRKLPSEGKKLISNYSTGAGGLYAKYFFKNVDFGRQFYWNIKGALREIILGKYDITEEYGISHIRKIAYNLIGAARFVVASIGRPRQRQ